MVKKNDKKLGAVVAVGMGIAAATAAAYLLFGPEGKKNRKMIRGWMVKMKGEVIEGMEKVQHVTEPTYEKIVDSVAARYAKMKTIDKKELEAVVADLKKHWKAIARDIQAREGKGKAKKVSLKKKVVKKVAKKVIDTRATS